MLKTDLRNLHIKLKEKYLLVLNNEISKSIWYSWSRKFNRLCSEISFDIPEYRPALNYLFIIWTIMNNIIDQNYIKFQKNYISELFEIEQIFYKEVKKLNE